MIKHVRNALIPHAGNSGRPHALRYMALLCVSLVAVLFVLGLYVLTNSKDHARLDATVYSSVLIDLTNEDRAKKDAPPLVLNDKLALAAALKAEDMASKSYFSHVTPEGLNSWHWFSEAGYRFSYAGENLAVDFTESDDVERAWMDSPTHRANILNQNFTEIGIATRDGVYKGRNTTFVAQMFGRPAIIPVASAAVAAAPATPISTTTTAEEKPVKKVLGETVVISEASDEKSSMIIGFNEEALATEEVELPSKEAVKYTPTYQRFLLEAAKPLGILLIVIGILLALSFVLAVVYHKKISKRFFLGALLALVIIFAGCAYLSIAKEIAPVLGLQ